MMNQELTKALVRVLPFLVVLIILIVLTKRKKIERSELALNKPTSTSNYFFWVIGFLVFVLLTEFTLNKFGILSVDNWNHPLYPSIIRIFGAVILAPIVEEFIFRGLILSKLRKKFNSVHLAIILQAILFVLLHNFTYENTLYSNIGIAQSLIDATLFGYARVYTKSIYTPLTMHITGNLIATLERFVM